jgi:hypothetical protein
MLGELPARAEPILDRVLPILPLASVHHEGRCLLLEVHRRDWKLDHCVHATSSSNCQVSAAFQATPPTAAAGRSRVTCAGESGKQGLGGAEPENLRSPSSVGLIAGAINEGGRKPARGVEGREVEAHVVPAAAQVRTTDRLDRVRVVVQVDGDLP